MALNAMVCLRSLAVRRQNHFRGTVGYSLPLFTDLMSTRLQISVSPDRGDGARMSFIRMKDLPTGLSVEFVDYQDKAPFGSFMDSTKGCEAEDKFRSLATVTYDEWSRRSSHTISETHHGLPSTVVRTKLSSASQPLVGSMKEPNGALSW